MSRRGFKRRYLALKLLGASINKEAFWSSLIAMYLRLYGEYGLSKANLRLIEFRKDTAIVSVSHRSLPKLRAALTFMKDIKGEKLLIQVLGVSGTIKKLRAKFLAEA